MEVHQALRRAGRRAPPVDRLLARPQRDGAAHPGGRPGGGRRLADRAGGRVHRPGGVHAVHGQGGRRGGGRPARPAPPRRRPGGAQPGRADREAPRRRVHADVPRAGGRGASGARAARHRPGPLRLRAGVNWGEAVVTRDDVIGHLVNVAARVTETAKGGEVLVTEAVQDRVAGLPRRVVRQVATPGLQGRRRADPGEPGHGVAGAGAGRRADGVRPARRRSHHRSRANPMAVPVPKMAAPAQRRRASSGSP